MKNKIKTALVILSIFVIATLSGCVTEPKTITTPEGQKVTMEEGSIGPDWCKKGTKMTSSGAGQLGSLEIKGITKYDGKDVCEAEYIHDQGSMIQYFNENGDYAVMIYKDTSGNIIQTINLNDPTP